MKCLFFLLVVGSSTSLLGQSITIQVADSVCICLDRRIKGAPKFEFRDALNNCVGTSMTPFMESLLNEHNLKGYTVENIQAIQIKIIDELKTNCEFLRPNDDYDINKASVRDLTNRKGLIWADAFIMSLEY